MKFQDIVSKAKWILLGLLAVYSVYLWYTGVSVCYRRILAFFCGITYLILNDPRGLFNTLIILVVTLVLWGISSQNQLELTENPACYDFNANFFLLASYIGFNFALAVFTIISSGFAVLFSITMMHDFWSIVRNRRRAHQTTGESLNDLETKFLEDNFKINYDSEIIDTNTCSICLVNFEKNEGIVMLPECKHVYHKSCLDQWLLINSVCPYCRFNVRDMIRQRMDYSILSV